MKRLAIFALLVGLALCAPTTNDNSTDADKLTVNKDLFPDVFKIYTAEHDIVNILVPVNALNFDEINTNETSNKNALLFFVEADVKDEVKNYKGLSVFKNRTAKKLLETGTDASAADDNTKIAYFSATDGLYTYNEKENTAEKYGSITDNLISLAKANGSDLIYILTAKNEVYKVTNGGTNKEKVDGVDGAQQIVLDNSNNLYYIDASKQAHVINEHGVKKIEGLPANPNYVNLIKPPFVLEDGVPIVVNDKAYLIYLNGTSELTEIDFQVKPTAYAMEATIMQYFGYDKSIYEYNVLAIVLGGMLGDLQTFLNDKTDEIQSIATRSRNTLTS